MAYGGMVWSMEYGGVQWTVLWIVACGDMYCIVVLGLGRCDGGVKCGILTWCILGVMRSASHNLHLQLFICQLAQKCNIVDPLG